LQLVSPTTLHEHDFVTAGLTETSWLVIYRASWK